MTTSRTLMTSSLKTGLVGAAMTVSLFGAAAPSAHADSLEVDAKAAVSEAVERTVSALSDASISASEADRILEMVDIDRVAQFSLGNHWKSLSEDQKTRYLAAFRTYANKQLQSHLKGFSNADVEVGKVHARGARDAIVQTLVTNQGKRQTVSWRVMDSGSWKVVDIEVQDIWFAIEQRAQFDAMLDKNGGNVDALIRQISA